MTLRSAALLSSSMLAALALSVAGCGGRVAGELLFDPDALPIDDGGGVGDGIAIVDSGAIPIDSGGPIELDSGFPTPFDSSVPPFDSGVPIPFDGGGPIPFDSGVPIPFDGGGPIPFDGGGPIPFDSGGPKPDSGIVIVDGGSKDTGLVVTDTGVTLPDGGVVGPTPADCDKIAKASCTSATKACCEKNGYLYDSLGCEDASDNWCDDGRDGVYAGKTTYDPSYLSACADAWTKLTTTCSIPALDYIKTYVPCSQMLNGKTAPGGVCTRSTECFAPAGMAAFCDDSSGRCRAYQIVGAGAACNYYGSTIRYCSTGYFCDYSGPPRCNPVTPMGGSCFGVDDTSCGIGNSCKAGKCAVGTPKGGACVRDLECASWDCSASKCTDPNLNVASPGFCSGI